MKKIGIILLCLVSIFMLNGCEKPVVIPFELLNDRIVFNVTVNGNSGKYMWDTGAFLSHSDCTFENLKYLATTSYALLGSSEYLSYYELDEIIFNTSTTIKAKSKVSKKPKAMREFLEYENLDGVLGNNIFNGYWVNISFSDKKVYLYKSKPFLLYNKKTAVFENDNIITDIEINKKKVPFIFDTGTPDDFLFTDTLKNYLGSEYKEVLSKTNKNIFLVKIDTLGFSKIIKRNVWALTDGVHFQTTLTGLRGNIGIKFIKTYDWLIDYSNLDTMKSSYIYFRKNRGKMLLSNTLFDSIPKTGILKAGLIESGIYIVYIDKNCDLATKGLVPGSLIIEINGKDYKSYSTDQLIEYIYNPKENTTYTIDNNNLQTVIDYVQK